MRVRHYWFGYHPEDVARTEHALTAQITHQRRLIALETKRIRENHLQSLDRIAELRKERDLRAEWERQFAKRSSRDLHETS